MFEQFYTKSQKEIVRMVKDFMRRDFFPLFPKWKDQSSIIICGSVAAGRYDEWSDIDVRIFVSKRVIAAYSSSAVKSYKQHLNSLHVPIQFHAPETFEHVEALLQDWSRDWYIRDYSQALIVEDTLGRFKSIQKKYRYYPSAIRKEKIEWLMAEAIFHLHKRFEVAAKRKNLLLCELTKLRIIRLLLNAYLLGNKKYPAFDKHLYAEVKALPDSRWILTLIDDVLTQHDAQGVYEGLSKIREGLENFLLSKKLIKQRSEKEWIDLRPAHRIEFEI